MASATTGNGDNHDSDGDGRIQKLWTPNEGDWCCLRVICKDIKYISFKFYVIIRLYYIRSQCSFALLHSIVLCFVVSIIPFFKASIAFNWAHLGRKIGLDTESSFLR